MLLSFNTNPVIYRASSSCSNLNISSCGPDVMQVAHHYFENGITHFTRRINKCISLGCANGEVAPFVGHNAFLRWSAVQDASFIDPADNVRKQWSEANVSEDFDLALRLLLNGYTLRWATYSLGGFKEGVSLTVVDELARWQKYAYGGFDLYMCLSRFVFFGFVEVKICLICQVVTRSSLTRSSSGGVVVRSALSFEGSYGPSHPFIIRSE